MDDHSGTRSAGLERDFSVGDLHEPGLLLATRRVRRALRRCCRFPSVCPRASTRAVRAGRAAARLLAQAPAQLQLPSHRPCHLRGACDPAVAGLERRSRPAATAMRDESLVQPAQSGLVRTQADRAGAAAAGEGVAGPDMRILLVHNRYKFAGGEDVVVAAEKSMLQD